MRLAAALLLALIASAQDTTFKSEVRLVQIYATVFDKGGRAVDGLSREQFQILDEGAPQPVRVFEPNEKALSCALLLDTTGSMHDAIPALRNGARSFVDSLRPADAVVIYAFTEGLDELAPLGTDRAAAHKALTRLRAGGRTALFDAISDAALRMERVPGKKAIVVLTDGGDNASVLNRQAAAERARKAGIPVFAVAEGEALHDPVAEKLLRELSHDTGGRFYRAKGAHDVSQVFDSIASELQNGYLLAFSPEANPTGPIWHRLQVIVTGMSDPVTVRARTGYSAE